MRWLDPVLAIAWANLVRLFRERANLFFVIVLPILILYALGVVVGGVTETRLGVVDPKPTDGSAVVADRMGAAAQTTVVRYSSERELRDDVARGALDGGWSVARVGDRTTYRWFAAPSSGSASRAAALRALVEELGMQQRVVDTVAADTGAAPAEVADAVAGVEQPAVPVNLSTTDAVDDPASVRAVLAGGQLTLFIFLTSLTGAGALFATRTLGVTRRVRAGPVPVSAIVAGEALGRFLVALTQGAVVFFGAALVFGVDWRAPGAVLLLIVALALVGTGLAMLLGTLGTSQAQVGAIALLSSLVLAALGGSMQPLSLFPDTLRRVALFTPHAQMNDALERILTADAGLGQVWPQVATLLGAGVILLALAARAMARTLR